MRSLEKSPPIQCAGKRQHSTDEHTITVKASVNSHAPLKSSITTLSRLRSIHICQKMPTLVLQVAFLPLPLTIPLLYACCLNVVSVGPMMPPRVVDQLRPSLHQHMSNRHSTTSHRLPPLECPKGASDPLQTSKGQLPYIASAACARAMPLHNQPPHPPAGSDALSRRLV